MFLREMKPKNGHYGSKKMDSIPPILYYRQKQGEISVIGRIS